MAHNIAKPRVHFRRPAGQIDGADRVGIHDGEKHIHQLIRHCLGARRTRVDMAMQAALIAQIGQIHLQGAELFTVNRREIQSVK